MFTNICSFTRLVGISGQTLDTEETDFQTVYVTPLIQILNLKVLKRDYHL